jgi:hypothetical protein
MPLHLSKWSERDWTTARIDRFFSRQNYRLFGGIHLSDDAAQLCGSLCIVQGRGKYLRVKHVEAVHQELPQAIQRECQSVFETDSPDARHVLALGADLIDHQAVVVDRMLCAAGKYVDRVLCITLDERGIWLNDFDGKRSFTSLYRPQGLAERTGANIVDAIRERDCEAGGNGLMLDALPAWLTFVDRTGDVNDGTHLLVHCDQRVHGLWLPATDGSDETVPGIAATEFAWDDSADQMNQKVLDFAQQQAGFDPGKTKFHVFGSRRQLMESIDAALVGAGMQIGTTEFDMPADAYQATMAAVLGALFVDQMPANVPQVTGASSQRILGRITPGKPMTWRNLLINMNDGDSPIMRLRDAI